MANEVITIPKSIAIELAKLIAAALLGAGVAGGSGFLAQDSAIENAIENTIENTIKAANAEDDTRIQLLEQKLLSIEEKLDDMKSEIRSISSKLDK